MINGLEQSTGLVFLSAALVNNLVLEAQIGTKVVMEASVDFTYAARLAMVSMIAMSIAAPLSYFICEYLLAPLELTHLKLLMVPVAFLLLLQLCQQVLKQKYPQLIQTYAGFLPLLILNCSLLSVLLMLENIDSIWFAFTFGLGVSVGFSMALMLMTGLSHRLILSDTPQAFKGLPIKFISIGILSMAFSGLTG